MGDLGSKDSKDTSLRHVSFVQTFKKHIARDSIAFPQLCMRRPLRSTRRVLKGKVFVRTKFRQMCYLCSHLQPEDAQSLGWKKPMVHPHPSITSRPMEFNVYVFYLCSEVAWDDFDWPRSVWHCWWLHTGSTGQVGSDVLLHFNQCAINVHDFQGKE